MLSVNKPTKVYKSKSGEPVTALNEISLDFGSKGLVFLLGKSGSGKSTLLNLLGGIDSATSGEVIIDGRSSLSFKSGDYDGYRNTYVGFVFQEYNLIPDYNVGSNISLALQLQGKAEDRAQIEEIMRRVDLIDEATGETLYERRISELSGGQKQRVAIARALIKNPKIILADEPTGALDSKTGEKLFGLLKELSKDKLIIVVSHDKEFAQDYGDRIIELRDGEIRSDKTRSGEQFVPTEEINAASEKSGDAESLKGKDAAVGGDTAESGAKFIKSKLPFKRTLAMGLSGLKHKKFRLVSSVILSFIAFAIFAVSAAAMFSDYQKAELRMLYKNDQRMLTISNIGEDKETDNSVTPDITDKQFKLIKDFCGGKDPMIVDSLGDTDNIDFIKHLGPDPVKIPGQQNNPYLDVGKKSLNSFAELDPETGMEDANLKKDARFKNPDLCRLPQNYNEIAVTDIRADMFIRFGYTTGEEGAEVERIASPDDLIGKKIGEFTICGVFSTEFDKTFFEKLDRAYDLLTDNNYILDMVFGGMHSYFTYGFVKKGFFENTLNRTSISRLFFKISGSMSKDMGLLKSLRYETENGTKITANLRTPYYHCIVNASTIKDVMMFGAAIATAAFCLFSALLTMNFLSSSMEFKKRDLGVLRALGAGKKDIAAICLVESLLLACICFAVTVFGSAVACFALNLAYHVPLFSIWFAPLALTFLLCFGVSAAATILPALKVANKKPVDVINGK